jgi:hypothetical protein
VELQRHRIEEQARQLAQLQLEDRKLYAYNYLLRNVNVSLETFALDGGIWQYLCDIARSQCVGGFVRRHTSTNVEIFIEATRRKHYEFFGVLKHLQAQHVIEDIDFRGKNELDCHINDEFCIKTNAHIRCAKNPRSKDHVQWEKIVE